jgi:uncharacterized RDD family membrane protein YckC
MENVYPSVLDRIKSTTIDSILIIACMIIFSDVLSLFENVPDWVRIVLFISLLMYEPICTTIGSTLGNHKIGIQVRKSADETKTINIVQATVRYFFKLLFGWASFISIFFSPKSRTLHDIIARTIMTKTTPA